MLAERVTYTEKVWTHSQVYLPELGGDLKTMGRSKAQDGGIPILESYQEATVTLSVNDDFDYFIEKIYSNSSPSYSFNEDYIGVENNPNYMQIPSQTVVRETDDNGLVTFYMEDGSTLQEDFRQDADFLQWKADAQANAEARIASIYHKLDGKGREKSKLKRIERMSKKAKFESKKLKNNRILLKENLGNNKFRHLLFAQKTSLLLSESILEKNELQKRVFYKYKSMGTLNIAESRIEQDFFKNRKNGTNQLIREVYTERSKIKVEGN